MEQGLSFEIESAIDTLLVGLNYDLALDTVLKKKEDYRTHIGSSARIVTTGDYKLKGRLFSVEDDGILLEYYAKEKTERVRKERKVLFSEIKECRSFENEETILEADKMQAIISSKTLSFSTIKQMLLKWTASTSPPSELKKKHYVSELILAGEKAIVFLRSALAYDIDYDSLEPHRIAAATKVKPVILEGISSLTDSIEELKSQMVKEKFDFGDKEFKIGYPERFARQEFFPRSDYHKQWYNTKEDAIMICPFGTKGEIIELDDLRIQLPVPPRNKKKILFSDLPKKEQYWRRIPPPDITPDNISQFEDYIMEEYRRRREGIWFMNNGKAVYLPGNAYWALQHCKMKDDGDYMNFRYAQLDMFYHLEACIIDPRCLGQLFVKSRRTGFTYVILAILLNMATSTCNALFGMTSKTDRDAGYAFGKFSYMFLNLPFYFRPVVKSKEDSEKEIVFARPSNNSKEAKKSRDTRTDDYLNTTINFEVTKDDSYDGQKLNGYLGDECFGEGTEILMSDLTFKKIEDIRVGDVVVAGDGNPAIVVDSHPGYGDLYRIEGKNGFSFVVNSNHGLRFEARNQKRNKANGTRTIRTSEYCDLTAYERRTSHLAKVGGIEFPEKTLSIEPYMLGLWLGDGFKKAAGIIVNPVKDPEIKKYFEEYAEANGYEVRIGESSKNWEKLYLKDETVRSRFADSLRDLRIYGNKHIPEIYKYGSVEQRMQLLAGLIDSDGYVKGSRATITMSNRKLVEEIYDLSKSCGLPTTEIKTRSTNFNTTSYSITIVISSDVPTKVERKKASRTSRPYFKTGFSATPIGKGVFYGIALDRVNTVVLRDYTVQSNSGKWKKPHNYIKHLGQITPTMMPHGRVVGKAFIGSTVGAMNKGGAEFQELYGGSRIEERDPITKQTPTGLYAYFLDAQSNVEQCTDIYGVCHKETPPKGTLNVRGELIEVGSIEFLIAKEEAMRKKGDFFLNEQYRAMPRTIEHAFRDESANSIFNLTKCYAQRDYNNTLRKEALYQVGNFRWKDGIKDTEVEWCPDPKGRFKISWMPSDVDDTMHLRNAYKEVNGKFYPSNDYGVLGVDPFSIKNKSGKGSKGAISGKTRGNAVGAPQDRFFLEYCARPQSEEIFFEDVIMACVFYGIQMFVESNRIDLLRYVRNRGYRPFSMNRVDRPFNKLSDNEVEYGGQPMSGQDMLDSHMNGIGHWIEKNVGICTNPSYRPEGEMGDMPFNDTINDWIKFDPDNRTPFDLTISSGLAIMGTQVEKYKGEKKKKEQVKILSFIKKYDNRGSIGRPMAFKDKRTT